MTPARILACLYALALPLCAFSQNAPFNTMPSVARPGPGEPNCKKPEYPKSSVRNEEQGVVTLQYLLDKDGAILEGKILKSSGFAELDRAALVTIAKCAFKIPAGQQEPFPVTIQYVWSLD